MLAVTTGCDLDPTGPGSEPSDGSPTGDGPSDPDAALVGTLRSELLAMVTVATQAATSPDVTTAVRTTLVDLASLHLAHADALALTPSASSTPGRAVVLPWPKVRARERRLQNRLADASVAARSGALARLLASMSAAVAQHLAAEGGRR